MKKLNNFGFTPGVVLLIVLIVGLIGGTGYYVYKRSNDKPVIDTSTSDKAPESTQTNEEETDTTSYLTIKEWGVKVPLDSSVSGLSYEIDDTIITFNSTALKAVSEDDCTSNIVSLARGKANDPFIGETGEMEDFTFADAYKEETNGGGFGRDVKVKIGDYYFVHPAYAGASCAETDADQVKESTAGEAIVKAVKAMTAAN